jgi:antitoxin component of RelBE/YafQ-DinJ toxin-antitoxin module
MSRKKLTLSVEERLTRRAKTIAKKRGTSVSRLVETFFTALEQEGGGTFEVEQARKRGERKRDEAEQPGESKGAPAADYEPSAWARQWRGAFAEEEETYPDDPSWEQEVLAKEIEKKHAS